MATSIKKCPLCMGAVKNGQCIECGYVPPAEDELDEISKIYNLDPEDYPDYKKIREEDVMPPPYKEEEVRRIPNIAVEPRNNDNNIPKRVDNNYSPQNNFTPYQQNNYGSTYTPQQPQQGNNYGQNNGNFGFKQKGIPFKGKHWAFMFASLFIPVLGFIIGGNLLRKNNDDTTRLCGVFCLIIAFLRLFL